MGNLKREQRQYDIIRPSILVKNNRSITPKRKLKLNSLLQNNKPHFNVIAAKMAGKKGPED
jgi:hypothetical protein